MPPALGSRLVDGAIKKYFGEIMVAVRTTLDKNPGRKEVEASVGGLVEDALVYSQGLKEALAKTEGTLASSQANRAVLEGQVGNVRNEIDVAINQNVGQINGWNSTVKYQGVDRQFEFLHQMWAWFGDSLNHLRNQVA